jgi:hypothetical protein
MLGIVLLFTYIFANVVWESRTKGDKIFGLILFGIWCFSIGFIVCMILFHQNVNQS